MRKWMVGGLIGLAGMGQAFAGQVAVAVAANFSAPMQQMAQAFARDTGHQAVLSFGATGALSAQIRHGAPFDVLLAADDTTPARLEKEGDAVAGTRFTYAVGQLVLWSPKPGVVDARGEVLRSTAHDRLALANPKVAPYGAAALQTLERLGLLPAWQPRLVYGDNISQAYQYVASDSVPLGFVALSQVMHDGRLVRGSAWVVPEALHQPLRQDAVLLRQGQGNPAALALLSYLKSDAARAAMRAYGYR